MPTGCGNSSILIYNCPLKGNSNRKYLFEIVWHAGRILSKAFPYLNTVDSGSKENGRGPPLVTQKVDFCSPLK